ncbi:MAG TPA: hypothetical protein VMT46_16490 [Anaerolineaceae bacterium]|nr:hypothetical protein [Anaerolineaceae bacterium]
MLNRANWQKMSAMLIFVALVLTACTGAPQAAQASDNQNPSAGQGTPGQGRNGFGGVGITADTPLESKLAVGLLKLEGTSLSVTPAEAKQMLPLWEKVKSEETAFNPAATPKPDASSRAEQLQSLYQEIEKTLTPQQLKALQDMSITGAELRDLMTVLEITPNAGNFAGGGLSAEQRATAIAEGTQMPGDFSPQRATQVAEGTQVPNGFGRNGTPGTRTPRNGTPGAGGLRGGFGFNNLFLDPLIKMLQTRASSG